MNNTKNIKTEVVPMVANSYTSKDIKSLDGVEAIQLRPG
jgi:hypothetical protein